MYEIVNYLVQRVACYIRGNIVRSIVFDESNNAGCVAHSYVCGTSRNGLVELVLVDGAADFFVIAETRDSHENVTVFPGYE